MFCHKCGSQIADGSNFCQKCGAKLIANDTTQQPAASKSVQQTQTSPVSSDTPKKKKSKKLAIILGIAVLVVAAVIFVALNWEGKTDYVATVRAHQPFVSQGTSLTYGEVLDKYINSADWKVRNLGDVNYVDISGKAKGKGNELLVTIKVTDDPSGPDLVKIAPESVTIDGEKSPAYDDAVEFLLAMFLAYDGRDNDLSELLSGRGSAVQGEVSLTETYTDEAEGFSFSYPSELKFNDMVDYGVEDASGFSCLCLLANDVSASPYTQMSVLKNSNPQFVKSVFSDDSQFLTMFNYNLDAYSELETSIEQLDGRPVRLVNYVQDASDTAQAYSHQVYIYVSGPALYQINFACRRDETEKRKNIFDAIMDSYTITAANASEESGTESAHPSIRYKGISISAFLGSTDDVIDLLGDSPLNDEYKLRYDDMEFYHDNGAITSLVSFDPGLFEADGIPLNKNRDGLIEILGEPSEQGGESGYYFMSYNLPDCSLYFELGEPDSEAWRISISPANTSEENAGELSIEELRLLNDFINTDNNYGFLLSEYATAGEINLNEVLYNGTGETRKPLTDKEIAAYLEASGMEEIYTDITKLTTQEINTYLNKKLGITLGEITGPFDWTYVEEFDSWYFMAGDTNFTTFTVTSGRQVLGDLLELECTADSEWKPDCRVTLRKTDEGYQFVSNVFIE